jgi:hypothetical protein
MEAGIISFGIVNCRNIPIFCFSVAALSVIEVEKKNHGKRALKTKREKLFISVFITCVKIKFTASVIKRGVMIAHDTPNNEPEYLALSCETAMLQSVFLYAYNF